MVSSDMLYAIGPLRDREAASGMKRNSISPVYRMTPGSPAEHAEVVARIVSEEFAGGENIPEIMRKYLLECHYDWDVTRLIWDAEQLIHHWGVWGYDMRLAGILLRVAGVGAVVTSASYRQQGLMRQAALESFQAMREAGYQLSILRGRHYARFGYVRAWNYVTYRLNADELLQTGPEMAYQALGPDFMPQINTLYNVSHREFSGTAVRPTYSMLDAEDMQVYGWTNAEGDLEGYVRATPARDGAELQCLEAAGDPAIAMFVLVDLVREGGYDSLSFFTLPYDHPIPRQLRTGAVQVEERYFHHSGWQVKVINLSEALRALRPVLEARLAQSRFEGWQGALTLDDGHEKINIEMDRGRIDIQRVSTEQNLLQAGPAIGSLLLGSDAPAEILRQSGAYCLGSAASLAEVLFPPLHPVMSHWDEF
jgi:predicted N-acetyltransferase YhbS